jgi:simple sugar transport system permease protein
VIRAEPLAVRPGWRAPAWAGETGRFVGGLLLAGAVYALVLLLFGKDPLRAYAEIFQGALGDSYGWTEVLVKMIPFVLTALAAALPAQLGLINVGAEGQLYMGAIAATWIGLNFADAPAVVLLPAMIVAGFVGGGAFAGVCGALRAKLGLNETISTLLLNYVAIRVVDFLVHGPWKDPSNFNWPYTAEFSASGRLPVLFGARVHAGLILAVLAVALLYLLLTRTRWGYEMRAVGGNAEAARRGGLNVGTYLIVAMIIAGGLAGIAGMAETSAIQGRLRAGISQGYGYIGFLASWLAMAHPLRIVVTAALLAVISVGGDVIQIAINLPSSAVNVLMALILFGVLGTRQPVQAVGR